MSKTIAALILLVPALGIATAIACGAVYFFAGIALIGSPAIYIVGLACLTVTGSLVPWAARALDI